MTKRRRDERGAAMVEFAIILPLLVLLLMGVIEFGSRLQHTSLDPGPAAREGAHELTLRRTPSSGDASSDAAPSADLTLANVSPGPACPGRE